MKRKEKSPTAAPHSRGPVAFAPVPLFDSLPPACLALTLFLAPLFPDEKLNRLKLIVLGSGLLLSLLLWALSRVFSAKCSYYSTPLDKPLILYAFSAFLYYHFSSTPSVAASELQRMVFSVGAFWVAVQVCSGPEGETYRKWVLTGWLWGAVLASAYGLLQKSGGIGRVQVPQIDRVFSTFGNPIFLAAFLIQTLPWTAAWLGVSRKRNFKLFLAVAGLVQAAALFHTRTRAAFLALPLASLGLLVLIDSWRGWPWARAAAARKKAAGIFLAALVLGYFLLRQTGPLYRGILQPVEQTLQESRVTSTAETHTLIWKDVLRMWFAHPWLGTGYGTFHIEFPQYASEDLKRIFPQRERIVNDAHNEYLQILAETGLTGLLIFAFPIAIFYLFSWSYLKKSVTGTDGNPSDGFWLYTGMLAGVSALLIQNFFSVDMRFIVSSAYLFLAMGFCTAFYTEPESSEWPAGSLGKAARAAWVAVFALVIGLVGISPSTGSFYFLGVFQLKNRPEGWTVTRTPGDGPGLLPTLLRPYLSQRELAKTPDFFDEKLLNNAQTLQELEALVLQHPDQWRYWEKLGYFTAKEMQGTDAAGRKVIRTDAAQRAIQAFERAFELNPQGEGPPNNLGNIYFTLNRRPEAMDWWQKAIAANPEKIDARVNLGLCYYYEGRIKDSARQFEEVLKRDPKNEKAIVMLKRMVE